MEQSTEPIHWRNVLLIAAVAFVVWWVWRRKRSSNRLEPVMTDVTPTPPKLLPGISATLPVKLSRATDTRIPVVMTSGSQAPYDEGEIKRIAQEALDRLNSQGEKVTLIQVVNASKTIDSYKTVSYNVVISVHDSKENVGMMLALTALVPTSGKVFLRSFNLFNTAQDKDPGPPGATGDEAPLAKFEDPISILKSMKTQ